MRFRDAAWLVCAMAVGGVAARTDAAPDVVRAVEEQLRASPSFDLYVMTDKPMYRPGETISLRIWELARAGFESAAASSTLTIELVDPRGGATALAPISSAGAPSGEFALPADAPGGRWTVRVTSSRGTKTERAVVVSTYELPRIKKELAFLGDGYTAGDEVVAVAKLHRATGEPLAGARVTAMIWLDGVEIARTHARSDKRGGATIRFRLPSNVGRGDCLVTLLVQEGGVTESMQRRVPLRGGEIQLALFPEGGDLVAGLPSRVYFVARSALGEPVDVTGRVIDDRGAEIARIESKHRGMGRFAITPAKGRSYRVTIDGATATTTTLPAARENGCVMATRDDFGGRGAAAAAPIVVDVRCTGATGVVATAIVRERVLDHAAAEVSPGAATALRLAVPRGTQGVARVTLFDDDRRPIAERLVYRGLGDDLAITIDADRDSYAPRDSVTLTVETKTRDGAPIAADLAIAVVDDTVLSLADDRSGRILARLYLEPEMPGQTIDEPNFYFSGAPDAPEALDLLLGTHGWRRFVWRWVE